MSMSSYRPLVVALLASTLLAACGSAPQNHAPPAPAVSVAEVLVKDVQRWDEFSGHVEAVDTVEIRPRVPGYIERVAYAEGQEVKKGDLLFVIDQRTYRSELAQAQAGLVQARTQSELAASEVARAQKLAEARAISREELDQRVAAELQSTAAVAAAQAALDMARLNMEFTEVRSPIDGRAGRAMVTAGNLVSGGTMVPNATLLTTVVSLDPVYVTFEGDEQTYLRYGAMSRAGERPSSRDAPNPVQVGLANEQGFPHTGHMDFVDNQVDPGTGTIRARAVLDNKDRAFTPGLFARVKLLGSGSFTATLVDDKAVLTDQDRKYVYVLGPENRAIRKDVKLDSMIDGLRVVTEGLSKGDKVIVHGVQKVFFPGMPVQPQTIAMGDPPPPPPKPGEAPGKQAG